MFIYSRKKMMHRKKTPAVVVSSGVRECRREK